MSFQLTSTDITLDGTVLSANCKRVDGEMQPSSIDLDPLFGNINGQFQFGQSDFAQTANDYSISTQDDGTILLTGNLQRADGSWDQASIDLSEYIANMDGNLTPVNPN
ncbi:hypothetical protein FRB91_000435 [Serendipita sp. 411]|nr:hypothetical protein FRC15_005083 [Serendipita sp. 397]KAG8775721.1 hypothetical protein FRC16_004747 [Serendipita sp. 398]KAG8846811.1 hypothetical protein FRB91_000435 [Serendipita sp. 411]KAG8856497.1 hypothetical protein FRC20_000472 [Serendipita sp. 405]